MRAGSSRSLVGWRTVTTTNCGWAVSVSRVATFVGFWIVSLWDLPVSPTDVVLLGTIYAIIFSGKALLAMAMGRNLVRHKFVADER